jgi:muramoyltetrapeptide carboxypeptidase
VLAKTGAVTWAGPAVGEDFGVDGTPDDIMEACFDDLIGGQGEGTGWQLPRNTPPLPARKDGVWAVKDAVLWGGNLAVLSSLVGTPWLPAVKGGVLFLEEVHEHPYRVERMLTQLLHAGVLAQQKAIVMGQFTNYKLVPHDKGFKLQTVVDWLRTQDQGAGAAEPAVWPCATKVLLPVGAKVDLAVEGRDAFMLWGHRH